MNSRIPSIGPYSNNNYIILSANESFYPWALFVLFLNTRQNFCKIRNCYEYHNFPLSYNDTVNAKAALTFIVFAFAFMCLTSYWNKQPRYYFGHSIATMILP